MTHRFFIYTSARDRLKALLVRYKEIGRDRLKVFRALCAYEM
jgi:hypothetical protein